MALKIFVKVDHSVAYVHEKLLALAHIACSNFILRVDIDLAICTVS